jgi:hypothetical protein
VKDTEGIISKIGKMLSEAPVKSAEVLNLFLSRFFSFLNFALLGFFGRILAKLFNS